MNSRLQQRLQAEHMLDKYDQLVLASVPGDGRLRRAVIFRKSELDRKKREYGEALRIIYIRGKSE
jgi:hypothetical protein